MKIDRKRNLIFVVSWSVILFLSICANIGFLRLFVGLPYALFLPGYLLLNALSIKDLSTVQKYSLSFGASLIVIGLLGLGLNFTPLGLKPMPVYLSLVILVISLAAIPPFHNSPTLIVPQTRDGLLRFANSWKQIEKLRRYTLLFSCFSMVGIISLVIWRLTTVQPGEKFTEFYVLDQNLLADSTSLQLEAGQMNEVVLGIFNREQEDNKYSFDIQIAGGTIYSSNLFMVKAGDRFEQNIPFNIPASAADQEIVFRLFKAGNNIPYRTLHLWEGKFEPIPIRGKIQ